MVNSNRFYVYAFLRQNGTPYYIGKGTGNRAWVKRHKGVRRPKENDRIVILWGNLTEEEAFFLERECIEVFGRVDLGTGILHNKTAGGEGTSGRLVNEQTRQKLREANSGENHPLYGKSLVESTRRKMSFVSKGKPKSEQHRKNISESKKGEKNPNFGKTLSEKTRRKMSEARVGEKNAAHGTKWWVNVHGERRRSKECPGSGWRLGLKWVEGKTPQDRD